MPQTHAPALQRQLIVPPEAEGQRLDRWLAGSLKTISRSRVQKLIASGLIKLSGEPTKAGRLLQGGEELQLTVPAPAPTRLIAETILFEILAEDDDLVVVNKPSGLVVHPGAGHAQGTLVNGLLRGRELAPVSGAPERPGIVHRLDRGTSGVMVVAKTELAYRSLVAQFKRHEVSKHYLAWVRGAFSETEGRIEAAIGRDPRQRQRMKVLVQRGKPAVTEFKVLQRSPERTLLEVHPLSGRTHQIRVHLSSIGHPILGDRLYGGAGAAAPRLMLHAWQLELWHPRSGRRVCWIAPPPVEFELAQ